MNKFLKKISTIALFLASSFSFASDFLQPKTGLLNSNFLNQAHNINFLDLDLNKNAEKNGNLPNPLMLIPVDSLLYNSGKLIDSILDRLKNAPEVLKKLYLVIIKSLKYKQKNNINLEQGNDLEIVWNELNTHISNSNFDKNKYPQIIFPDNNLNLNESWQKFSSSVKSAMAKGLNLALKGADLAKENVPTALNYAYKNPREAALIILVTYMTLLGVKDLVNKVIPEAIAKMMWNGILFPLKLPLNIAKKLIGYKKNNGDETEKPEKENKESRNTQGLILIPNGKNIIPIPVGTISHTSERPGLVYY